MGRWKVRGVVYPGARPDLEATRWSEPLHLVAPAKALQRIRQQQTFFNRPLSIKFARQLSAANDVRFAKLSGKIGDRVLARTNHDAVALDQPVLSSHTDMQSLIINLLVRDSGNHLGFGAHQDGTVHPARRLARAGPHAAFRTLQEGHLVGREARGVGLCSMPQADLKACGSRWFLCPRSTR